MKRILLLTTLLIVAFADASRANTPNFQIGVQGGADARFYSIKSLVYVGIQVDPNTFADTLVQVKLSGSDAGYQAGFFFRVTVDRKYAQAGINFVRSSVPIFEDIFSDTATSEPATVRAASIPLLVGYRIIETPLFKWRVNTGLDLTILGKIRDNPQGFVKEDFVNPRVGARFGTGIDIAFFTVDFNYTFNLRKEFRELDIRTQSHGVSLIVGVLF